MGTFDPNTFLDVQITDSNATQLEPVPVGEYLAMTEEPAMRTGTDKNGNPYVAVDIPMAIDDAGVKAKLGRDKVTVRYGMMLELNESGGIDTGRGKNVKLGRLRDALGLNESGKPFSFRQIAGRPVRVTVKQRVDGEAIYSDVSAVARAG